MSADESYVSPQKFIDVVHAHVYLEAISSTRQQMLHPSNRALTSQEAALAAWYPNLSERDRSLVDTAVADSAQRAVFHLLCLLDNVAPIVDGYREELLLKVVRDGIERPLTPGESYVELHDLFKDAVRSYHESG